MGLFDGIQRISTGDIAHDAADSGSPVKIGARARNGKVTRVSTDDRTQAVATRWGSIIVSTAMNLDANGTSGGISNIEDMTFATSLGGTYAAANANSFTYNKNNWAAGHTEQFYRVLMFGFRSASVVVKNALGQLVDVNIYASLLPGVSVSTNAIIKIASVTSLASSSKLMFSPFAAGPAASTEFIFVEALQMPMAVLIVGIDPQVQPTTSEVRVYTVRQ